MQLKSIFLLILTVTFSSLNYRASAFEIDRLSPNIIAQNAPDSFCSPQEKLFIFAETKDFWINICGTQDPETYIGVNKKDGKSIRIALNYASKEEDYYEAINGNYTYYLIRGTAKGDFLGVTEGNKQIVQQPILNWEEY
jgi:hypothetical protein